jgi:hypothetical protein
MNYQNCKSIFERLSTSFLNARNGDFGENCPQKAYVNGHLNITTFCFRFFANQI